MVTEDYIEWGHVTSLKTVKIKQKISTQKIMYIAVWDRQEMLLMDY